MLASARLWSGYDGGEVAIVRVASIFVLGLALGPAKSTPPAPSPAPKPKVQPKPLAAAEPVLVESCEGARTQPDKDVRMLSCARWRVAWHEGGTVWGFVIADSYDAVVEARERQLGFARRYARFFEVPLDERYTDPSPPICDTCQSQAPAGRWGEGQKFGDAAARKAIEGAETALVAFDKALDEHLPRLTEVARLSHDATTAKGAKAYAKQMRQAVLDLAKARLALDNAVVFRSDKSAADVTRTVTERTEALDKAYTSLLTAVGREVGKAHAGRYLENDTPEPERPYLEVEVDAGKVTATYFAGGAQSTWFTGQVALDGGITGRSLLAPEKGGLTCKQHSVDCGYVYVPSVLRFTERKDPAEKAHHTAELWFQRSSWVMAKPFSR